MMRQFEVIKVNGGEHWLTEVDTSRWHFYLGFRRYIKTLL